jgi:hypothetical protein
MSYSSSQSSQHLFHVDVVEAATSFFWNIGPRCICEKLFSSHMDSYVREKSSPTSFDAFFASLDNTKKREYMQLAMSYYSDTEGKGKLVTGDPSSC